MKVLLKQSLIVGFSSILLASCATTEGGTERQRDLTDTGSDCISIRTVRDYTPLDRDSLLVEGSGHRYYYVTLVIPAIELRGSHQIGMDSRDEWLCPYGGDKLVFDGFRGTGYAIRGITRIDRDQADELLYQYGKKTRPEQIDPAPAEIESAEVEELGEVG